MLKSSLCDYSDAYILVKGTITITGAGADAAARQADERDKGVAFKNCAPFTACKSNINNVKTDNCIDIDIVMSMYNLIEYSDNYAKTSGSLWLYYRDGPNDNLADSESNLNPNLDYLIETSFQGVNRIFALAFENEAQRKVHSGYYLPNVKIKNYNVMINGENFFDQPIKDDKVTYEKKIITQLVVY